MCGIGGIIYKAPRKLDITAFNIIGSLNDERGGDSCGVFIDGYTKYGIGKTAKYRNLIPEIEFPETSQVNYVHCRKTSFGYTTNLAQAQPVVITKGEEVEYVLMHNGTIKNVEELAKKYIPDFDTKDKSDSQIMAQIMYEKGYDVLNEYTGCAVFAIIDYREDHDHFLFWKGSSGYNPTGETCERPLYVMYYEGDFYFSSMQEPLMCINPKYDPLVLSPNKLCYLGEDMQLHVKETYDRSKIEAPKTEYTYTYNQGHFWDYDSYSYPIKSSYITYEPISGLYFNGKELADGEVCTYSTGYCYGEASYNYGDKLYFWKGKLLWNVHCYDALDLFNGAVDDSVFNVLVDYLSYAPVIDDGECKRVDDELHYYIPEDDSWVILFNNPEKYQWKDGILNHECMKGYDAFKEFLNLSKTKFQNEDEIIRKIGDLVY